jgi:hypothetical protein
MKKENIENVLNYFKNAIALYKLIDKNIINEYNVSYHLLLC